MLIQKGAASLTEDGHLVIDLKKLSLELYEQRKKEGFESTTITIRFEENALGYSSKWAPDDRIADAISKYLPDEIFLVRSICDTNGRTYFWYVQNGHMCNQEGEKVFKSKEGNYLAFRLNNKLANQQENGDYNLSLPIGDDENKWVSIAIPKANVYQDVFIIDGVEEKRQAYVYFTEEFYQVDARNKSFQMSSEEICNKYCKSKNEYSKYMSEELYIPISKVLQLDNRGDYFIIYLSCPPEISSTRIFSLTVPDFCVREDKIDIGPRGKAKNVVVTNEDGAKQKKSMPIASIYKWATESYEQPSNIVQRNEKEQERD